MVVLLGEGVAIPSRWRRELETSESIVEALWARCKCDAEPPAATSRGSACQARVAGEKEPPGVSSDSGDAGRHLALQSSDPSEGGSGSGVPTDCALRPRTIGARVPASRGVAGIVSTMASEAPVLELGIVTRQKSGQAPSGNAGVPSSRREGVRWSPAIRLQSKRSPIEPGVPRPTPT